MSDSRDDNRRIKDPEQYDALRDDGMSKEKAARIANTDREAAGRKGGRHPEYEDWSVDALYEKAQQIGIGQRSEMSKDELIRALREH
ncbi:DUF7218 family protein [Salinisphaera orenii]|uniref:Rho termination factor n=1 Tax=Salinisphaera orenii YIM 95161 TaxID=1051139 RepID=A0A423Q3W6_9GAMM|nr:Rho termination factor [Salinisphaera halophila]ROO33762.1 hypothetical protein SAHL_03515 [Salinisphaera halophila YIM 95161]